MSSSVSSEKPLSPAPGQVATGSDAGTVAYTEKPASVDIDGLHQITGGIITLMGLSFILGVLFTTFLLLVLDFMRRNQPEE
jgi:hypothetical protein